MQVEHIFAEIFSMPENAVSDALALREIPGWDSMSHMRLIVRLEEVFSVEFTGDEIADFRSVGDIREAIGRHSLK